MNRISSGQFSGQIPNQGWTSLPGIPHPQQQNIMCNNLSMEPGFFKARQFIQERIL
ncbi:hypothetical protein Lser_V15G18121 [Lactuca serriola]